MDNETRMNKFLYLLYDRDRAKRCAFLYNEIHRLGVGSDAVNQTYWAKYHLADKALEVFVRELLDKTEVQE